MLLRVRICTKTSNHYVIDDFAKGKKILEASLVALKEGLLLPVSPSCFLHLFLNVFIFLFFGLVILKAVKGGAFGNVILHFRWPFQKSKWEFRKKFGVAGSKSLKEAVLR